MTSQSGNDYTWLPIWFRLQRVGNVVTAYQSPDGIDWYPIGESTVSLPEEVLIGFAASGGGKPGVESVVAFDNVDIGADIPEPPAAPSDLSAKPAGEGEILLSWENHATDHAGFKVEAAGENDIFYEIADLPKAASSFVNTGLKSPAFIHYRVRAYNTGGYSKYSNAAGLANRK